MKKFALLIGLLVVLCSVVYSDPPVGHRDFVDLPFLSEVAVVDDPAGAALVVFTIDLGVDDFEMVPDFSIRILDMWFLVEATDEVSYTIKDGEFGDVVMSSFNTTNLGLQRMKVLDLNYDEIDILSGESIYIDALPTGTTAVGRLYIMAVRIL